MSFYLDASLAVAALTNETGSPAAVDWLERRADRSLITSPWLDVEVASALSMKERQGQLDARQREEALDIYSMLRRTGRRMEMETHHFAQAARLCGDARLKLRAGDSLHLALCIDATATLCTLDRGLAAAAQMMIVPVEQP